MYGSSGPVNVVNKRMSALGVLFAGVSMVVITLILCGTAVTLYGMRVINLKTQSIGDFVATAAQSLDELRDALPPALAEAWQDRRRPDYLDELRVGVKLAGAEGRDERVVVDVENTGEEVVSLLSLRLIALDPKGSAIDDVNTWAATPMQLDDDWRGPILPHSTRRFPIYSMDLSGVGSVTYEVSDIRVWGGEKGAVATDGEPAPAPGR